MRFASPSTSRAASTLMLTLAIFASGIGHADVTKPDGKPGFLRRIIGGGSKETPPPPAPEKVEPAPEEKPAAKGSKSKGKTTQPKPDSTENADTTGKKSAPEKKDKTSPAKKQEPTAEEKPASAEADTAKPDEKPGFLRRIIGGGSKDTPPPPAPEKVEPAAEEKTSTTGSKSKTTASRKSTSTQDKKDDKKDEPTAAKKPEVTAPEKSAVADADAMKSEEKPGLLRRILGGGPKETPPPPAPETVEPTPEDKPATPGPRPKVTTIKPKSGGSSKSSTTAKKSAPAAEKKTEPALVKKTEPAAPATTEKKIVTLEKKTVLPEKKTIESPAKKTKGDGEFGTDDDDKQTAAAKTAPAAETRIEPNHPLPASHSGGWKIVKVNGRDYIAAESIHQFYRFSSIKIEGTHVWLKSNNLILKAQIGSQEILINNIKFILSYPVIDSGGSALFSRLDLCKLIDPVLRPTYITDAEPFDTVVVDAGHGGHDSGARGVYGYEKDFALQMAASVKDALQRKGFKVILTRNTDTFITLGGRVAVANATPRSIFLSLHFNSGDSSTATGIETFALTPQGSSASLERGGGYNANGLTGNSHDSANIALATAVHAMVISKFKFVDRGIKRAQWSVLTGCKRPGVLFEGGFVTNGNECRLIASDTYRQSVSAAIAEGIVNYRTALRGAMTHRR